MPPVLMKTGLGVLVVAAVATAGDYIWYTFGVRHSIAAGLIHGALLLTAVGAVLGAAAGRVGKGLPIGTLAGIGGAASYYALVALMDRRTYGSAIPVAWMITWLLLATLDGRWLRAPERRTWMAVAGRGITAATVGGMAFVLVMNVLWGRPPDAGRSYLVQFLAWAFAWAPGILALTFRGESVPVSGTEAPGRGDAGGAHPVPSAENPVETTITGAELLARIDRGDALNILDVRSEGEFAAGHVPGAVNIPFTQVMSRMHDVPGSPGEALILYCGHGPRAYMAAAALAHGGRARIVYMSGHWAAWQAQGLRVAL